MTSAERQLCRGLNHLIRERCGSIAHFCILYGYKYEWLRKWLQGKGRLFDGDLYRILHSQALAAPVRENQEATAVKQGIIAYYGSIKIFARRHRMRHDRVLRILNGPTTSKDFYTIELKWRREAMYQD